MIGRTPWSRGVVAGVLSAVVLGVGSGCSSVPRFRDAVEMRGQDDETILAFDVAGKHRLDYWQYQGIDGRIRAIAYPNADGQPGPRIDLDAIPADEVPHFLIALDGVPLELVEELRQQGSFRLFHSPARVVCCYPSMTDLALSDVFHTGQCHAYQALCFDRDRNRLSSGDVGYVSGRNSPWLSAMTYRCSLWWDALVYLKPDVVFNHELKGMLSTFRGINSGEAFAYSVGSAGLGTRGGREAIVDYLRTIDRLCEQIVYERHGRVKLTLTADHGHNLTENRRITFEKALSAGGYRLRDSLRDPRDVVAVSYGLVTYAELFTHDPAGVAQCLLHDDDVEFACYPDGDAVLVRDRDGQARIQPGIDGFIYDARAGDPLHLSPIIEKLRADGAVSPDGSIHERALFEATLHHDYPDPLERVWRAFHGLVEAPPDLIVNLRDGACHGSGFFYFMVRKMASTHGSLNRMNSTTFVLTTLGDLPPAMRSQEVLPALEKLRQGH